MNKLIFNISVILQHETITAEQMAEDLQEWNLIEFMQASLQLNPNAISVAALTEEAENCLYDLYKNTNINLWAEEDE